MQVMQVYLSKELHGVIVAGFESPPRTHQSWNRSQWTSLPFALRKLQGKPSSVTGTTNALWSQSHTTGEGQRRRQSKETKKNWQINPSCAWLYRIFSSELQRINKSSRSSVGFVISSQEVKRAITSNSRKHVAGYAELWPAQQSQGEQGNQTNNPNKTKKNCLLRATKRHIRMKALPQFVDRWNLSKRFKTHFPHHIMGSHFPCLAQRGALTKEMPLESRLWTVVKLALNGSRWWSWLHWITLPERDWLEENTLSDQIQLALRHSFSPFSPPFLSS